jgi:hypothetical protein
MKRNSSTALAILAGRLAPLALSGILIATTALAQSATKETKEVKQEKEHPVTSLKIVVTGGDKDLPVSNASVYVRYEQPRFLLSPEKIELDLKTDLEGIAKVKDVPRTRIMIQVVKGGWRPFGEYYQLTKDEQTIPIKMLPPAHWY